MADETRYEEILDTNGDGKVTANDIIRKFTSRKFWMSIATFVFLVMVYMGADENSATQIVAIIMAGATIIGYTIGEGLADKGYAVGDVVVPGIKYPEYEVDDEEKAA